MHSYNTICRGKNDRDGIHDLLTALPVLNEKIDPEILIEKKKNEYMELIKNRSNCLFNGVNRVLKGLRDKGYTLILVTSSGKYEVEYLLNKTKIYDYFDDLITDDDVKTSKPSCEGYRLAAERLDIDPSRILVIEDSIINLKSAKRLGMRTLAITGESECQYPECDYYISSLGDLLTY